MAMAFSKSSRTTHAGIVCAGRVLTDPLNPMEAGAMILLELVRRREAAPPIVGVTKAPWVLDPVEDCPF